MRAACLAFNAVAILALAHFSSTIMSVDFHVRDPSPRESNVQAKTTTGAADVPTWRVNDNWMYDGFLDVGDFVADSGVSTDVETLDGSLDRTVQDIYLMEIDGKQALVYEVESIGEYESDGAIQIDGTSGCLYVDIQTKEIIRVSDLATYSQEVTVDVYFDPLFFGCASWLRQDIGELVVENTYEPPLENYDFPVTVGESWGMDYEQATDYSGSSNYVDIPEDSSNSNSTSWSVVSQGNSGVAYPGCYQSFNVTAYDSDGEETGYNWFCPAVRGEVKSTTEQAFGFLAVHELVSYQPVQRGKMVSIDVQYPLSPTDIEISAWINVTNQGQGVSGQEIQFRYESDEQFQNVTTNENGTYQVLFNSGDNSDDTDGPGELGSHGLIAWISDERIAGGRTLVLDSEIHEIDLVTTAPAVTVQRFRSSTGKQVTLDSTIGFAAIPGDVLAFSVPVLNRGLIQSPQSTIVVSAPDGTEVSGTVPPLGSLEESRVVVNWTVPESQPFGNVYLYFEVDPQREIPEDGNRTNNQGSFVLYIGGLPLASLHHPSEAQTHEGVTLDATSSYDSDGGEIECEFHIQKADGSTFQDIDEDCILEWSWPDDGSFLIEVLITDGEGDRAKVQSTISILNRPPEISIGSDNDEVIVTNPITFYVTNSSDIDTMNPSAPVEILWDGGCSEGQVGQSCTLTPIVEGALTVSVMATDDDGAITTALHSVRVTNIAPSNPVAELYLGETRIFPDSRGVFIVHEGDNLTFWGQADDSSNDLESLKHVWKPDAEYIPELNFSSSGERSTISGVTYNTSGMHLATLQVFDDNNESTEVLIVPIQVENVPPVISPITTTLGQLEEDEEFTISPQVIETGTDSQRLVTCFDLDPVDDSDSDGRSRNDCDVESPFLIHSWPDSTTAPDSIIFHVTDDDGESASIEFSFSVVNTPPAAFASASVSNPTEGDKIVLSANGTVDSQADMDTLQFHWDIDITSDSDGDGDPANDVDYTGRWIEFSYGSGGSKKAKLTVLDDVSSHSVTMDIQVAEAPISFSEELISNIVPIIFTLIVISAGAWVLITNPRKGRQEEEKKPSEIDLDAAFDEPETPTVDPNEIFAPPNKSTREDAAILDDLDEVMNELGLGMEDVPVMPSAPRIDDVNSNLDPEDIEALFEE